MERTFYGFDPGTASCIVCLEIDTRKADWGPCLDSCLKKKPSPKFLQILTFLKEVTKDLTETRLD